MCTVAMVSSLGVKWLHCGWASSCTPAQLTSTWTYFETAMWSNFETAMRSKPPTRYPCPHLAHQ